jgi:hypothetical protein
MNSQLFSQWLASLPLPADILALIMLSLNPIHPMVWIALGTGSKHGVYQITQWHCFCITPRRLLSIAAITFSRRKQLQLESPLRFSLRRLRAKS